MHLILELTSPINGDISAHDVIWPFHCIPRKGDVLEIGAFISNFEMLPKEFRGFIYEVVGME